MVPIMVHHGMPCLEPHLRSSAGGADSWEFYFFGMLEYGSSGAVAFMPPQWQRLWVGNSWRG